jgi:hypothetical protein
MPEVARGFIDAMNDYFMEEDPTKRDAIAHQRSILAQYLSRREKPLRLSDVKTMFDEMWDHA